nr:hypothetical protein [uncultured Janthinobacterium sp.]
MTTTETEVLAKLADAIEKMQRPALPLSIDLWDTNGLAAYFKRSTARIRSDIVCLPTFPRPIRLPVDGRSQALYKAREVIAWAEKHTS